MYDLIPLRNRVAHFRPDAKVKEIDEYLDDVQNLMCCLYDAEGAVGVRLLRDELQQAAEAMSEDVAAVEGLAMLPFPQLQLDDHIVRTLQDVLLYLDRPMDADRDIVYFPGTMMRLARDLADQRSRPVGW